MAERPLLKAQDGRGATTKSKGWQRGHYLEHRMAEGLLLACCLHVSMRQKAHIA